MTHLSSQNTSTGNMVIKQGTSVWGVPFSLIPLQQPLLFQQAGVMQSEGCVSVQTVLLIPVFHFAASLKREEQSNLTQIQKCPESGSSWYTHHWESDFKFGPELWTVKNVVWWFGGMTVLKPELPFKSHLDVKVSWPWNMSFIWLQDPRETYWKIIGCELFHTYLLKLKLEPLSEKVWLVCDITYPTWWKKCEMRKLCEVSREELSQERGEILFFHIFPVLDISSPPHR